MNIDLRKEIIKARNNQTLDLKVLESKDIDTIHSTIYFMGIELTGGIESTKEYEECYFYGDNEVIYYLQDDDLSLLDSNPTYNTTSNATLRIYHNDKILTILNYSLLDSSLNIKLESKSKESQAILEKEKEQREKEKAQTAKQDSNTQATAMLHPIIESDELKCPHNGVVKLKSIKGRFFTSDNIPLMLESDLLNSQIIGCTNTIAGIPSPCLSVSTILPSSRALKKYNDDYPIMQDLCVNGVMSDKGFPITCTPKANRFKINAPSVTQANKSDKESLLSQIKLYKPSIRLYYKEHRRQIDNIPLCRLCINDNLQDSNTPFRLLELDIHKDSKDLQDKDLKARLQYSYPKDYEFKEIDITIGIHSIALIFIIPQKIPKVYNKAYKEYEYKEYGVGRYTYLYEYCDTIVGEKRVVLYNVLYSPAKMKKIELEIANGLDGAIEEKEGVLKMILINTSLRAYNE